MSISTQSSAEPSGSLLGWLGRRGNAAKASAAPASAGTGTASLDVGKETRRQLMDAITAFLFDNDLEITSANLLAAHGAFSGDNPRLTRQLRSRMEAEGGIDQEWLDEVTANQEKAKDDSLEQLIQKLETNIDAFAKSSGTATKASREYGAELEQHIGELDQIRDTGQIISSLADIAKTMLDRTRKVEEGMRKSEEEAKSLRQSLARAKRDAEVDHLTGLPNRRAFENLLETHYREAQKAIEPLSVAFCDIDHFKRINDTHGHDTGDRVIQAIAEALSAISDDNCHVARHGGEEFVMLFRGVAPPQAQKRLDDLRERFSKRNFVNRQTDEPMGQITFSGGIADVFGHADPRAALKAADEALYRAKEAGRNRIETA
jgi:diguanylate cyclase